MKPKKSHINVDADRLSFELTILLWCISKDYSFYKNFCIARTKYKHIVLIRQ
ncbi:hypothetical protein BCR33DRAFT_723072 [Rhizoclosmatium globosum]|uniref:Uncharacterized protein n=1 Tax=Rhizoclosmatium globosum TaxID=329046 RepID=A0A1Y2BGC3_9FUNG|nr:hypothetical protein BCR33DRAFT_723072 [Rhizoclosmatium globosum]|eukprot:ORY33864.1 hypothetical protein BCR33DRAFT_723072 [Rhizoclosmatium globosum]